MKNPHPGQNAADADCAASDFELVAGKITSERTLTRGAKIARVLVGTVSVALAMCLVLNVPAQLAGLFTARQPASSKYTVPTQPPMIAPLNVQAIDVPAGGASSTFRVTPMVAPGNAALACWIIAPDGGQGSLHIASYVSQAQGWHSLTPPVEQGRACDVARDAAGSDSALLSVYEQPSDTCALPRVFATPNGGKSWRPLPWPDPAARACQLTLTLYAHRIYAQANARLLPAARLPSNTAGNIITTFNEGRTWQPADVGLAAYPDLQLIAFRPDQLLAQSRGSQRMGQDVLWEASAAGTDWRSLGNLPGTDPQVLVSNDPSATQHDGWGSLYVIAERPLTTETVQYGSVFAAVARAGNRWQPLALPPPSVVFHGQPTSAIAEAGVGPGDSLIVTRFIAGATGAGISSARRMWLFDPATHQWYQSTFILAPNATIIGANWQGGNMRLWMLLTTGNIPRGLEVVTITSENRFTHSTTMTSK